MRAELGLPSVRGDDEKGGGMMGGFGGSMGGVGAGKSKRPINVKFEIPYFTTSGIQVRYLKIIEPKVRLINYRSNSVLTSASSNTRRSLGSATLRSRATLRCGCRTCSRSSRSARGTAFKANDFRYSAVVQGVLFFKTNAMHCWWRR